MACLPSTCPFCACGCGVLLQEEGGRLVASFPSSAPPARSGLCIRGWHCTSGVSHPERLVAPLVRRAAGLVPVSSEEAVAEAANCLARAVSRPLIALAPSVANEDATAARQLAGLVGGRLCTTDLSGAPVAWLALRHVPDGPRLLASSSAIEEADLIWVIGCDPPDSPQIEGEVVQARRRGTPVVRFDVRRAARDAAGTVTMPPDRFGDLAALLAQSATKGGAAPDVRDHGSWLTTEAARALAEAFRTALRPVAVVGGRWLSSVGGEGNTVSLLRALAALAPAARVVFAVGESNSYGVLDAVGGGEPVAELACRDPELDTVLAVGDDLIFRSPRPASMADALSKLRGLVVIDRFMTATAALADVVLPSCSFAEANGTVTNLFGEARPWRRVVPPPGASRPEREWLSLIASALAHGAGEPALSEARSTESKGSTPPTSSTTEFPFLLVLSSHPASWSTGVVTSRDEILRREAHESFVAASPAALKELGLKPGWSAKLRVPHAEATVTLRADPGLPDGLLLLVALPGSPAAALRGWHPGEGGRTVALQPLPAALERA